MTEQNRNTERPFNRNFNGAARPKRPYDPTDNKGRGYGKLWAVYPDYWPENWGQRPRLGFVRADTKFDAVYAAYDKGLSHPANCSFGLEIIPAIERPYRPKTANGNRQ